VYDEFRRLNVEVVGVSIDSHFAHRVWGRELGLPFPLLGDLERTLLTAYDALTEPMDLLGPIGRYNAYLIDRGGIVRGVWEQPPEGGLSPVDQVLEAARALAH
jgi:peroxiredoxin 2/4